MMPLVRLIRSPLGWVRGWVGGGEGGGWNELLDVVGGRERGRRRKRRANGCRRKVGGWVVYLVGGELSGFHAHFSEAFDLVLDEGEEGGEDDGDALEWVGGWVGGLVGR